MMERKIIFLVNPISGSGKKDAIKKLIKTETEKTKIPFEILHTNAAANYTFLKEKILLEKITDIVIVGGDGTVNQIVGSLRQLPVKFGIIPVGSGNGLARAAQIPTKPIKALN